MSMAQVQFYRNPFSYPDYAPTLTAETPLITCTPKGISTRGGQLHLSGAWGELARYNYIRVVRDGHSIFGWITNHQERGSSSHLIEYQTDALRTWRENIRLYRQFILRHPEPTGLYDDLLSSDTQAMTQDIYEQTFSEQDSRVMVVQVRRLTEDDPLSNTPVQPTPYQFYVAPFDTDNWINNTPITRLLDALESSEQTPNIVTIYSLPYMDISDLPIVDLPIRQPGGGTRTTIPGWRRIVNTSAKNALRRSIAIGLPFNRYELLEVQHDIKIVIPTAGVMNVTDEALAKGNLRIRQDVDLFSGSSNYMLTCGQNNDITGQSVRGSSVSTIPILSDPFDTYISQNQNALSTSMIGDVANMAVGAAGMATGNPLALGQISGGAQGLMNRHVQLSDMKNAIPSNPPSFLGTALANHFNNTFYVMVTYEEAANRTEVNTAFGYPFGRVANLTFPESGFIQTQNCSVSSDGTVPRWAIEEVNNQFNNGLRVRT